MMSPSPPEGDWGTGRGLAPAKSGGRPRDKTPVDAVETRNAVAAPDVASWGGAAEDSRCTWLPVSHMQDAGSQEMGDGLVERVAQAGPRSPVGSVAGDATRRQPHGYGTWRARWGRRARRRMLPLEVVLCGVGGPLRLLLIVLSVCILVSRAAAEADGRSTPFANGTCAVGFEPCFRQAVTTQYEESMGYQRLGSAPVPPELWNLTYTFWGKEYVAASIATGCAFRGNDMLVFANTQYENILVFHHDDTTKRWALSERWPTTCQPRGLALLPGDDGGTHDATNVLYACAEEGKIFNMSLADGTTTVLSAGIDFSPNNPDFPRSEYLTPPDAPPLESTVMQSATRSHSMMIDIKVVNTPHGRRALVTNKNRNHMIWIDLAITEFAEELPPCETEAQCRTYGWVEDGLDAERNRTLFSCCEGVGAQMHSACCNWRIQQLSTFSRDFLFPTGMDVSPDASTIATGTAYPSATVLLSELDASGLLVGAITDNLNSSSHGLSLHAYWPTYSPDDSCLYIAELALNRISKLVKGSDGDLTGPPVVIKEQLNGPRSLCVSPDSSRMGVAGAAEVGVLGREGCDLLSYCTPCMSPPAHNASFYFECEWRCMGGWHFQETRDGDPASDTEGRAQRLPSTGRGGYCLKCGAGNYSDFAAPIKLLNEEDCVPCPAGTFSNSAGATHCLPCPTGTFSATSGSTHCDACAEGKTPSNDATSCESQGAQDEEQVQG